MIRTDFAVIGSGPAGQKAAIQAAKAGRSVVLIERDTTVGGECVHRGTIPSKSLRQRAVEHFARRSDGAALVSSVPIPELLGEVRQIITAHTTYMRDQLERNGVRVLHGQAEFTGPHELCVAAVGGGRSRVIADIIVIATGSIPRKPPDIPVDHEHILDSDSILSLAYLPASLIVLGGGVIACEYASILSLLGVQVTMIDRNVRPLTFMDHEVVDYFVAGFASRGGAFVGGAQPVSAQWDDVASVLVELSDGRQFAAEKVLCALGRMARIDGLHVERAGLTVDARGVLPVNEYGQTAVSHIYAAGDAIGPPSLASASMEQGRRASRHALGLDDAHADVQIVPSGIYAVPELASVGMTEEAAREQFAEVCIGRARFDEIARGQITGVKDGLLKLVADGEGRLLGVHIVGEGATELVHIGQLAMLARARVETFVDHVFNFPTMAEAYRVAALQIAVHGEVHRRAPAPEVTDVEPALLMAAGPARAALRPGAPH